MYEVEQDVALLAAVMLLETMRAAYSGCVALFVTGSVSASLLPGVVLADLVMRFARMILVVRVGSMLLLLVLGAVVVQYFQGVVHH